jgi:hypothetical protein
MYAAFLAWGANLVMVYDWLAPMWRKKSLQDSSPKCLSFPEELSPHAGFAYHVLVVLNFKFSTR